MTVHSTRYPRFSGDYLSRRAEAGAPKGALGGIDQNRKRAKSRELQTSFTVIEIRRDCLQVGLK